MEWLDLTCVRSCEVVEHLKDVLATWVDSFQLGAMARLFFVRSPFILSPIAMIALSSSASGLVKSPRAMAHSPQGFGSSLKLMM
jgi:hypothetical protein